MALTPPQYKQMKQFLESDQRNKKFSLLQDDLEPGPLKDELLKDFDPSQETYEEYLRRKNLERPFNMADGGMLVQPSADGSRPGYAKDERGFGSEKGARFKSPSKNQLTQAELITLLEKELGPEYKFKRGSLSGDPKSSVKGGQRANYLQNMLKDLLDRKAVATRGEQVRFLFNKPNAQQLDFIKTFIDSPFLSQQTVRNMEILDKKFGKKLSKASGKKFFMKELTIDMARKTLEDAGVKDITTSKLARAMTRLAQQYQGKLFRNQPNIKINKKAGNFIFKSFNELDQYHPWRQGSYEAVLDDIDAALGKKVGKISAFKTKFKEKMQVRYPDRKFNFNEIFSISTSANRGSYPYAYFVDLTEDAMNKGALSSLQGKASIAEGKIQNNITKYRRTGNIKFYNEAVRVADVYNNTTRQNFLDSKKVLDYERKYGIKPNAYKIEIGSQRQVSDKLNFAKNFYKNSDLNKWRNMGIDIDAHSGQKGYVKAFDTKTLPKNIVTAPELFTKESVLRETKIIDDKKLNEFFNKNKKLIAVLGGGNCGRIGNYQGGRVGLQDGTPSIDVCFRQGVDNINRGLPNPTAAQARNFGRVAALGRNVVKFGVLPEALFVAGESVIRAGMGDTLPEAILRASEYLLPGNQTKIADRMMLARTVGPKTAELILKANELRGFENQIENLENEKQFTGILTDDGFDDNFFGQTKVEEENAIQNRINALQNQKKSYKALTEAQYNFADRKAQEAEDIRKSKALFPKLLAKARSVQPDFDDPLKEGVQQTLDLNLKMLPSRFQRQTDLFYRSPDVQALVNTPDQQLSNLFKGQDLENIKQLKIDTQNQLAETVSEAAAINPEAMFSASTGLFAPPLDLGVSYTPPPIDSIDEMEKEIIGQTNVANPFDLDTSSVATGLRGFSAAGGGIAKLAGVPSGPPPSSGPNSQGLQGLLKRVRNR